MPSLTWNHDWSTSQLDMDLFTFGLWGAKKGSVYCIAKLTFCNSLLVLCCQYCLIFFQWWKLNLEERRLRLGWESRPPCNLSLSDLLLLFILFQVTRPCLDLFFHNLKPKQLIHLYHLFLRAHHFGRSKNY